MHKPTGRTYVAPQRTVKLIFPVMGWLSPPTARYSTVETPGASGPGNLARRVLPLLTISVVKFSIGMVELPCFMSNLRRDARGINVSLNTRSIWPGEATTAFAAGVDRSEEHTSELQSLMRISYAVFCLKKKTKITETHMT